MQQPERGSVTLKHWQKKKSCLDPNKKKSPAFIRGDPDASGKSSLLDVDPGFAPSPPFRPEVSNIRPGGGSKDSSPAHCFSKCDGELTFLDFYVFS